ncbi:hypothetical protein [Dysgonomonas sp. 520]|uniref:hypothetical protein n=1 Tax=Dysgonomonas sp. 520 TaxID=2302931 RepID=UPI001C86B0D8|nr:hypothetical protein [Dysgonomonas sp. 520]
MKFICFLLLLVSIGVNAQSDEYVSEGNNAYATGRYSVATKKYRAALVIMDKENVGKGAAKRLNVEKKIYKSEEAEKLYNRAEAKFKIGSETGYKEAQSLFKKLVSQNKTDVIAQRRIRDCSDKLEGISVRREKEQEARKAENEMWEKVLSQKSKEAYENYLAQYPEGIYVKTAKQEVDSIDEEALWQRTISDDSLEQYIAYLSSSKLQKYKMQADQIICRKRDDIYWKKISESGDMKAVQEYTTSVSETDCKQYIGEGILMIRQVRYKKYYDLSKLHYEKKNYKSAIAQYDEIKKYVPLLKDAEVIYKDCQAEIKYDKIKKSKNEKDWLSFVEQYPESRHYAEMADKLALTYADRLNKSSTQSDYDRIMNLATDSKVKKKVEEKIAKNKKKKK